MLAEAYTGPSGVKAALEYTAITGAKIPVNLDAAEAKASPVPLEGVGNTSGAYPYNTPSNYQLRVKGLS
jgi:hypothetical protein